MRHGPKPFFGFPFPLPATEGLLDLPLPEELDASESRARHGFRGALRPLILDIFHFRHLTSLVNILQVAIVLLISCLKCF